MNEGQLIMSFVLMFILFVSSIALIVDTILHDEGMKKVKYIIFGAITIIISVVSMILIISRLHVLGVF